jgi:hypothetical protein
MPSVVPNPPLLTDALTAGHTDFVSRIRSIRSKETSIIRSFLFTHFSYSAASRPALFLGLHLFIGIRVELDLLRINI